MRKGFLTQKKEDPTAFGPLRDERSTHSLSSRGWGDTEFGGDPWVARFQEIILADQFGNAIQPANPVDENPYRNLPLLPYKTYGVPMNALGCYYSQYYHTSHLKMSDYYFTWNDENPKSHSLLWTSIFICPLSGELFISGKWPGNDAVLKDATPLPMKTGQLNAADDEEDNALEPPDDSSLQITTDLNKSVNDKTDESIEVLPPSMIPDERQVRWMKKKKIAEHGAAAWAYDCFQHRHEQSATAHQTVDSSSPELLPKKDVNVTSSIGSEIPYLVDLAIHKVPSYVPEMIRIQIEERLVDILNDRLKYVENNMNGVEEELAWCSPDHTQQKRLGNSD